jgi:hypothetical protein
VERAAALWLLYETHFHLQYYWAHTSPKREKKYIQHEEKIFIQCFHFHMSMFTISIENFISNIINGSLNISLKYYERIS